MVARRRLKRPPRRSAHLSTHRTHVSLAEAGIDRVASRVDRDVKVMRDELEREELEEERRGGGRTESPTAVEEEGEEGEEEEEGVKVAG